MNLDGELLKNNSTQSRAQSQVTIITQPIGVGFKRTFIQFDLLTMQFYQTLKYVNLLASKYLIKHIQELTP